MTVSLIASIQRFVGVAADVKPTSDVLVGSVFYETDTADTYTFDGTDWQSGGAAGGFAVIVSEDGLTHVRKTVTLDGNAGTGAQGTIALFTTTGTVLIERADARIVSGVSAGGGTLAFGVTGLATAIEAATTSVNSGTGFLAAGAAPAAAKADLLAGVPLATSASVIATVGTADITGGTLTVDFWYRAISDDGLLAAA